MGSDRFGWFRAEGLSEHELVILMVYAELDAGTKEVAEVLGLAQRTVKNHLNSARRKTNTRTTLGLYHRLVRGVRFETHVSTRMVVEE